MAEVCEELAVPVLTKAELKSVAQAHGGYATPSLNDTLYLHCKGYRRIENLEEYTGLKSLWLHSNGFGKIENLSHCSQLRCLFLQSNAITRIENLQSLESLVQLDLSENNIRLVEGLSHLTKLTTLNLSKNALENVNSISHLKECKMLSSLDLSKNYLAGEDIIDSLAAIAELASLNMVGNPVVSKVAYFRKKMIAASKTLRYLDRPVFDAERAAVEAWTLGGTEAEEKVKEQWHQMNIDKNRQALEDFRTWQATIRRTESAPHREIEEPELVRHTNVDSVISFCEEIKAAYVNDQTEPPEDDPPPLFLGESHSKHKVDVTENTAEVASLLAGEQTPQSRAPVTIEAPIDGLKDPFMEPIPSDSNANDEKGIFDGARETVKQKETGDENSEKLREVNEDDDTGESEFLKGKRIQDSIVMLKCFTHPTAKRMCCDTLGWTSEMDDALVKKTEESNCNFDVVAEAMSDAFRDAVIKFDKETCYRRFSFVDLTLRAESVSDLAVQDAFTFPSTKKPLANFLNADGSRKTIDDLCRSSSSYVITPSKIPDSEECDIGNDNMDGTPARPLGRSELWDMLESIEVEVHPKPDDTEVLGNAEKKEVDSDDLD
ncbi:hypothetical protein HJC23_000022 [Cyclotella cryptica]|uniref:Dynein assembly factor 1, axonemal homolog n=1 Tax=Cyclotella cryptica TaxID=29204 RepID=A0ABD3PB95_9STRA|eukprot:CCRYP_016267-RA/>CCRYP_016267-RA protein AED:0.37 eAED:0.37 QI:0/-1/0/1/-1/1/1/0/604